MAVCERCEEAHEQRQTVVAGLRGQRLYWQRREGALKGVSGEERQRLRARRAKGGRLRKRNDKDMVMLFYEFLPSSLKSRRQSVRCFERLFAGLGARGVRGR